MAYILGNTALGRQSCRQSLGQSPHLEGVDDRAQRLLGDGEAAIGRVMQQPLAGERLQRRAQRRARNGQRTRQMHLVEPTAGGKGAIEQRLPEAFGQ